MVNNGILEDCEARLIESVDFEETSKINAYRTAAADVERVLTQAERFLVGEMAGDPIAAQAAGK